MIYRFMLVLVTLFAFSKSVLANTVVIKFNHNSYVTSETVFLKDVVQYLEADEPIKSQLLNTRIMSVKLLNSKSKIDYKALRRLLESSVPISNLNIINKNSSYVQRLSQQRDINNDIFTVLRHLKKLFAQNSTDVSVKALTNHKYIQLPQGKVVFRYTLENVEPAKRVCIWFDYYVNEKRLKSVPVWFDVEIYAQAYYAKKEIAKGSLIDPEDIDVARVDITKFPDPITNKDVFDNKRAIRSVARGKVLSESDIEEVPNVYKGKVVNVIAQYGTVIIETKAEAQNDGVRGDIISLKRMHNGNVFKAVVNNSLSVFAIGE